ncbi:hypothetical protein [Brevundimonas sp. A19_0]|uniref:Pepco domain-containing protein n=1 Tax=Brevundimonas sp. A19_0 TaxID=2821087 RepID=UPI001ADBEF7A|nr:hypothetical protein [Brevundimonas sp. A19_0]MBO9502545.1 hypothetical protein [Brevundimonas sp. A19_0]
MVENDKDWEISLFVPESATPARPYDPNLEDHALQWIPGRRVEKVSTKVMEQWEATIEHLLALSSTIGGKAREWAAEEITIGFTLSAKGELLFIAEAGATASISVKLKRKTDAD